MSALSMEVLDRPLPAIPPGYPASGSGPPQEEAGRRRLQQLLEAPPHLLAAFGSPRETARREGRRAEPSPLAPLSRLRRSGSLRALDPGFPVALGRLRLNEAASERRQIPQTQAGKVGSNLWSSWLFTGIRNRDKHSSGIRGSQLEISNLDIWEAGHTEGLLT